MDVHVNHEIGRRDETIVNLLDQHVAIILDDRSGETVRRSLLLDTSDDVVGEVSVGETGHKVHRRDFGGNP